MLIGLVQIIYECFIFFGVSYNKNLLVRGLYKIGQLKKLFKEFIKFKYLFRRRNYLKLLVVLRNCLKGIYIWREIYLQKRLIYVFSDYIMKILKDIVLGKVNFIYLK